MKRCHQRATHAQFPWMPEALTLPPFLSPIHMCKSKFTPIKKQSNSHTTRTWLCGSHSPVGYPSSCSSPLSFSKQEHLETATYRKPTSRAREAWPSHLLSAQSKAGKGAGVVLATGSAPVPVLWEASSCSCVPPYLFSVLSQGGKDLILAEFHQQMPVHFWEMNLENSTCHSVTDISEKVL